MLGIDIVKVSRFKKIARKDYSFWDKFFSKEEWDYCFSRPGPAQSLAGVFAAKEAVFKALESGDKKDFTKIDISHAKSGQPIASIKNVEKTRVNVSISHEKDYAVSVAIVM